MRQSILHTQTRTNHPHHAVLWHRGLDMISSNMMISFTSEVCVTYAVTMAVKKKRIKNVQRP